MKTLINRIFYAYRIYHEISHCSRPLTIRKKSRNTPWSYTILNDFCTPTHPTCGYIAKICHFYDQFNILNVLCHVPKLWTAVIVKPVSYVLAFRVRAPFICYGFCLLNRKRYETTHITLWKYIGDINYQYIPSYFINDTFM